MRPGRGSLNWTQENELSLSKRRLGTGAVSGNRYNAFVMATIDR
jgi:hypothetical protein